MGCCGACVILICAPIANTFLVLSPEAKEYLYMMFGVMSYFVIAQAVNTTLVVGVFRLRRRYEIRINSGCVYDVGIFYITGCSRSIFLTRKCTGRLYTSDE